MKPHQYITYSMVHPIDGFEEMRFYDAGKVSYAVVIVACWFLAVVAERQLTGPAVNFHRLDRLNVLVLMLRSGALYALWIVANWAFCTLLDGEGTFKNIAVVSAYALVPMIGAMVLATVISRFITIDERVFIVWLKYVGIAWTVMMMVAGLQVIHGYTFGKTIVSIFLTVLGMAIIVFILLLLFSLYQQVISFVMTVISELLYRL